MKNYRGIEVLRALWGAALLIDPDRVLRVVDSDGVDGRSRAVVRILGARQLVQASFSGLRPSPEVLAMGVWVDTVHSLSAVALALAVRRRARAGYTDATIAGAWSAAGYRDLSRAAPRTQPGPLDRLAEFVLHYLPGGRRLRERVTSARHRPRSPRQR
ncbi:hypothetical protein [Mycolicibacterium gadium]|jgi:hypothetical protein|uniref:hypothetical protein n=1 Tax=Mycolicibacterium gadium TaxID=1794 RepID=UPI002FDCC9C3